MTEAEWLACRDPRVMLEYLETLPISDRKYTLTACATRRQSKRFDDSWEYWNFWSKMENGEMDPLPSGLQTPRVFLYPEYKDYLLAAIHDVVGNPFRPLANSNEYGFDPAVMDRLVGAAKALGRKNATEWILPARVLTDEVKSLALAAYEERAERGQLDPFRLNLLADAMEEAGCPSAEGTIVEVVAGMRCPKCGKQARRRRGAQFDHEVRCGSCSLSWEPGTSVRYAVSVPNPFLSHLRSPGPHYQGCHVLDAVLGYS